ncbi:OPT-domain-containing protein [Auriscalpium vulgare]|uniref:OPT-domain-containing protein n=1 Tax=Auriscalpium vulgare TaxID=40419 RepID=A0ACB8RI03_9AGAM|nr:OPT-domain-containing protein [Auriscalpium vulgare]
MSDDVPQLTTRRGSDPSTPDEKHLADVFSDKEVDTDSSDSVSDKVIEKAEDVAVQIISTEDDPELPVFTFRTIFLGVGLSAFGAVLGTIYTFKPQNASVSQLFCLIIAYVFGTAMHAILPSHGYWRYLNPGPFNIKEHTAIVIMASTASTVAVAMEVIAALDLFYDIRLNAAVAIFQIFASQMIGYGIAGLLRNLLVYPTYAFYPTYISVVNLLQSLHFGGLLNHKKRRYFWIVFTAIFFWEWIPQYPFPLLTAISVICLISNGRSSFIRNS